MHFEGDWVMKISYLENLQKVVQLLLNSVFELATLH
jgi:hypothetical protein